MHAHPARHRFPLIRTLIATFVAASLGVSVGESLAYQADRQPTSIAAEIGPAGAAGYEQTLDARHRFRFRLPGPIDRLAATLGWA